MEIALAFISVTITVVAVIAAFRAKSEAAQLSASNASLETELKQTKAQLESVQQEASEARELRTEEARLRQEISDVKRQVENSSTQIKEANSKMDGLQDEIRRLESEKTKFETDWRNAEKQLEERNDLVKQAKDSFKALSADVLEQQSKQFLDNAGASLKEREQAVEKLVKPISKEIKDLGNACVKLGEKTDKVSEETRSLSDDANYLASVLDLGSQNKGQLGEIRIERLLELSGLVKGENYKTQVRDNQGGCIDFIVYLPNDRCIILDSKVTTKHLMEAQKAKSDDDRTVALNSHAEAIKKQANELAAKEYWKSFSKTPDFVVMVVHDSVLPVALERDPELMYRAFEKKVAIATHLNLAGLLKCIAMGWQEFKAVENAKHIVREGQELYGRLLPFVEHLMKLGTAVDNMREHYNGFVGSFESSVIPQARRFPTLGIMAPKRKNKGKLEEIPEKLSTVSVPTRSPARRLLDEAKGSSSGKSEFSDEAS